MTAADTAAWDEEGAAMIVPLGREMDIVGGDGDLVVCACAEGQMGVGKGVWEVRLSAWA